MSFHLIQLDHYPIDEQLLLEEQLLRHTTDNYIIINEGTRPSIVMGISGQADQLIHLDQLPSSIPLIRRFSGGGTVIVDEETVFITFICNKSFHPFAPYPEPILRWAASVLQPSIPALELRDNDFVIGSRKCGGNALYIKKDRWLVHSSLLWNYNPSYMQLLKYPPKTPVYRAGRSHDEFLCRLKDFLPDKQAWIAQLLDSLKGVPIPPPTVTLSSSFSTTRISLQQDRLS